MLGFVRGYSGRSLNSAILASGLLVSSFGSVAPASAVIVGGGTGGITGDCLSVFDAPANVPTSRPKVIRCIDGDPSCDSDGAVNGACVFAIRVCLNSTAIDRCELNGVDSVKIDHAEDNGDPKFDPDYQALQARVDSLGFPNTTSDACSSPMSNIRVQLKGPSSGNICRRNKKTLTLTSRSTLVSGKRREDRDTLRMTCLPAQSQCLPQVLFSGTFDRIQRQIFNQSCALSACHDSQSQQASLLLEEGASLGNLIEQTPNNLTAAGLGWKLVDILGPTSGDPATSFLMRKLEGNLAIGLGSRMPLGRPALSSQLQDVVRLWIEAGSPPTGWVPGTDQ